MPSTLQARDEYYCWYEGNRQYCSRSAWDNWVRWVVLVVVVLGFFLLFVCCSCITARRRRKAGRTPFYGTGWATRPMPFNNNQQPHNAQPYYNNPAPPYTPQPTNGSSYYAGTNQGYYNGGQPHYGQQQQGVELQSPQPTYNRDGGVGGQDVYSPPAGPPPGKV